MLGLLILLAIIFIACIVAGSVVKGLFWLIIVGAVLLVGTAVLGWVKRATLRR